MDRRSMLAGLGALGGVSAAGCAGLPPASDNADAPLEGLEIYSESAQFSCADAAGAHVLSVRVCQYPSLGLAWLWATALTPAGFRQFHHHGAAGPASASLVEGATSASYRARAGASRLAIRREGTQAAPTAAGASGAFTGLSGPDAFGPRIGGPVSFSARFEPAGGVHGQSRDRSEIGGAGEVALEIDGERVAWSGRAQFHEQPQTRPRFIAPFVYASLWGEEMFATLVRTAVGPRGFILDRGEETRFSGVGASPPGPSRTLSPQAEGAAPELWRFEEIRAFNIPVYGQAWRGSFSRGEVRGRPVIGFINNWKEV